MSEQAFCRFEDGWIPTGAVSKDGLPAYKHVLKIRLSKPPLLDYREEATEVDIENHNEAYKLYLKLKTARDIESIEGYPLALWPAINTAEFEQLAGHGIVTVEQLAKMTERGGSQKAPEAIMQLAQRAKRLMALQKAGGKFEAVAEDLRAQRDTLAEQLKETSAQLSAANTLIGQYQARLAGMMPMPVQAA